MPAKRILILTNRVPYPLNDGGNMAMKAMVDGYKANGWQVFLLCMNTSRHYVPEEKVKEVYSDVDILQTVDVNNDVKPLPTLLNFLFSKEPNHAVRFRSKLFESALIEALQAFKPSVVQVESIYLSTYLPVIKNILKVKTVLRLHNIEYEVWQRLATETTNSFKKYYLANLAERIKKFEANAWRQYDLLLPITAVDEQIVKDTIPAANTHVVPFGIDPASVRGKEVATQWVGYHLGAMDWLPNQEGIRWFINEVFPTVEKTVPDFKFFFAGRNMPAKFLDIHSDNIYCAGEVPDAGAFIADKKILIVPIRSGGGIRVKILEAMAAGKLVISTSVGMQGIDAKDKQTFLKADSPEEFTASISWALSNKDKAEYIALSGQKLVHEDYNIKFISSVLAQKVAVL